MRAESARHFCPFSADESIWATKPSSLLMFAVVTARGSKARASSSALLTKARFSDAGRWDAKRDTISHLRAMSLT